MSILPDMVPEDIEKERLAVCEVCEHKTLNICSKCGCLISLKVKFVNASCPLKKWEEFKNL